MYLDLVCLKLQITAIHIVDMKEYMQYSTSRMYVTKKEGLLLIISI